METTARWFADVLPSEVLERQRYWDKCMLAQRLYTAGVSLEELDQRFGSIPGRFYHHSPMIRRRSPVQLYLDGVEPGLRHLAQQEQLTNIILSTLDDPKLLELALERGFVALQGLALRKQTYFRGKPRQRIEWARAARRKKEGWKRALPDA